MTNDEVKDRPVGFFMTIERIYEMMVDQGKVIDEVKADLNKVPDNKERLNEHEGRLQGLEEKVSSHATTLKIVSASIVGVIGYIASRVIGLIG